MRDVSTAVDIGVLAARIVLLEQALSTLSAGQDLILKRVDQHRDAYNNGALPAIARLEQAINSTRAHVNDHIVAGLNEDNKKIEAALKLIAEAIDAQGDELEKLGAEFTDIKDQIDAVDLDAFVANAQIQDLTGRIDELEGSRVTHPELQATANLLTTRG